MESIMMIMQLMIDGIMQINKKTSQIMFDWSQWFMLKGSHLNLIPV